MDVRGDPDDFIPAFTALDKENNIRKVVQQVISSLKNNQRMGDHIKKKDIPKYYIKKHSIPSLYLVDLPQFWRVTYSIMEFEVKNELSVLMLELMNHDQYNKRFNIFKKKSH